MKPLQTKAEIIDWRKRAIDRVAARKVRACYGLERLNAEDAKAYERIIERYYDELKESHNRRVLASRAIVKPTGANGS